MPHSLLTPSLWKQQFLGTKHLALNFPVPHLPYCHYLNITVLHRGNGQQGNDNESNTEPHASLCTS